LADHQAWAEDPLVWVEDHLVWEEHHLVWEEDHLVWEEVEAPLVWVVLAQWVGTQCIPLTSQ